MAEALERSDFSREKEAELQCQTASYLEESTTAGGERAQAADRHQREGKREG
jgi:hypothetical protein